MRRLAALVVGRVAYQNQNLSANATEPDFKLFKRSRIAFKEALECLADRGYQGIQKRHRNSQPPMKKPRGGELSTLAKSRNRRLARRRVVGEHVIGKLKVFRILGEKYRNRRKRFGLRLNLMAGLYNLDLKLLR